MRMVTPIDMVPLTDEEGFLKAVFNPIKNTDNNTGLPTSNKSKWEFFLAICSKCSDSNAKKRKMRIKTLK